MEVFEERPKKVILWRVKFLHIFSDGNQGLDPSLVVIVG
jgi:hypothetical protein